MLAPGPIYGSPRIASEGITAGMLLENYLPMLHTYPHEKDIIVCGRIGPTMLRFPCGYSSF